MKLILHSLFILLLANTSLSQVNIVTTYPYIEDIVKQVGKENVQVVSLARGDYNPHIIIPKPSFIAKARKADLLIINGAQLEIGWLPPILKQANNADVQPGGKGFLDLSTCVHLIDIPASVSRELGDVHPDGNPHFYLNPDNIPIIAKAIVNKLCELDPKNLSAYHSNLDAFTLLWQNRMKIWEGKMNHLKGIKVIEYHKVFDYFLHRFGLILSGTIEPLPGIPPTTKHIAEVEKLINRESVGFILQDVYNPQDASQFISKKLGIKMIAVPHDVGSVKEADGIVQLYDEIVRRLAQ